MPKFTESQKTFIYQAKLYEFKKMNRRLQNLKGMLQHRKMENIPNH